MSEGRFFLRYLELYFMFYQMHAEVCVSVWTLITSKHSWF